MREYSIYTTYDSLRSHLYFQLIWDWTRNTRLLFETARDPDERYNLVNQNGVFLIRQTPQAHREVEALLVKLGVWAPRRVIVAPRGPRPAATSRSGIRLPPVRSRRTWGW